MKTTSRRSICWFVFIVCINSTNAIAGCMAFQGVSLCDNGDRQIRIDNTVYTTRNGELTSRVQPDYAAEYFTYDHYPYRYCYLKKGTGEFSDECYRFGRYYGDLTGN